MEQKYINAQHLSEFVETHNLTNRVSLIHFNAIVNITTAQNKITNQKIEVMISFDGYDNFGKVTLLKNDFDPYLYPIQYEAKWQKMEHIDGEYLKITDNHRHNPAIGKYSVKIIPLEKLSD
jgi:hypothetical protein